MGTGTKHSETQHGLGSQLRFLLPTKSSLTKCRTTRNSGTKEVYEPQMWADNGFSGRKTKKKGSYPGSDTYLT